MPGACRAAAFARCGSNSVAGADGNGGALDALNAKLPTAPSVPMSERTSVTGAGGEAGNPLTHDGSASMTVGAIASGCGVTMILVWRPEFLSG
jgi:hypothetical protein